MGGLNYPTTSIFTIIGSKVGTTRTPVALTTAYAGNRKAFETGGFSKLDLAVLYTMGAAETANSVQIQVEQSPDGTNFYAIPNESVTGGTSTLAAREFTFVGTDAAAATISVGLDIFYKYVRVSAKESGVAANAGTIYIEGTLGGK